MMHVPVSYTHLDVYKRQASSRKIWPSCWADLTVTYATQTSLEDAFGVKEILQIADRDVNGAVSYTHLDVYKRQHYPHTPTRKRTKTNCWYSMAGYGN